MLTSLATRNYRSYMKPLKVARIGNSRGVRIPAATLKRYGIGAEVIMEERSDGILLRPRAPTTPKLTWEDTAREMAAAMEDWSAWEATASDGLEHVPWQSARSPLGPLQQPRHRPRHPHRKR